MILGVGVSLNAVLFSKEKRYKVNISNNNINMYSLGKSPKKNKCRNCKKHFTVSYHYRYKTTNFKLCSSCSRKSFADVKPEVKPIEKSRKCNECSKTIKGDRFTCYSCYKKSPFKKTGSIFLF